MSKEYPTVNETIAYDEGFADAEDYWTAKEQERIVEMLREQLVNIDYEGIGIKDGWTISKAELIDLIKGEK